MYCDGVGKQRYVKTLKRYGADLTDVGAPENSMFFTLLNNAPNTRRCGKMYLRCSMPLKD